MRKLLSLLVLTATPVWAHPPVASPSLTFLPPEGQVVDLLAQDPGVRRAGAMLTAAQAEARGREAGPHEFTLRGEYVTRATNLEGRLDEWVAGVSRGIRLPGKAEADSRIGASGIAVAENGFGDARHTGYVAGETRAARQRFCGVPELFLIDIQKGDPCAFLGQAPGDGVADALRRARNDGVSAFQPLHAHSLSRRPALPPKDGCITSNL